MTTPIADASQPPTIHKRRAASTAATIVPMTKSGGLTPAQVSRENGKKIIMQIPTVIMLSNEVDNRPFINQSGARLAISRTTHRKSGVSVQIYALNNIPLAKPKKTDSSDLTGT